ncbi:MAG: alpha-glucosidase C-terminal domain-containing protein, partial [Pseudomonadota bacterium]
QAAANQAREPGSMLNFYAEMLAFRQGYLALAKGDFKLVEATEQVLVFERVLGAERLLCAFNLSPEPAQIRLPAGDWQADRGTPFETPLDPADGTGGTAIALEGWQVYFAQAR